MPKISDEEILRLFDDWWDSVLVHEHFKGMAKSANELQVTRAQAIEHVVAICHARDASAVITAKLCKLMKARGIDEKAIRDAMTKGMTEEIMAAVILARQELKLRMEDDKNTPPTVLGVTTLLTVAEVAEKLHVDKSTVRRWCEENSGPGKCEKGRDGWRIDSGMLSNWKPRKRRVKPRPRTLNRSHAWECRNCSHTVASDSHPQNCEKCGKSTYVQVASR